MQGNELEVFLKEYYEEIHRSAAEMLLIDMPDVTEELFGEFERTGERLGYERVYFTRRKYLAILGMEAILQVREERNDQNNVKEMAKKRELKNVLKKLCGVIESICFEETWALPAHVDRKAENWQVTVDLFAAETAQTLANLTDELWDELPEATVLRVQKEIRRRVLNPFFESEVPYSWWEGSEMNWNAVCAGAIGSVCIHFHNRRLALPMEFSTCISRICSSLTHYIDGFSDDGACMEGLGYYTYGMAFYVNFMREMEDAFLVSDKWNSDLSEPVTECLNSELPESAVESRCRKAPGSAVESRHLDMPEFAVDSKCTKAPESATLKPNVWGKAVAIVPGNEKSFRKLRHIAEFPGKCFFSDGRSVSFSDGDSRDTWRVGIWCGLGAWFDGLTLPNLKSAAGVHADSCYRFVNLKMDIFETEKYLERVLNQASVANIFCMGDREKETETADTCFPESVNHEEADEGSRRAEVFFHRLRESDHTGIGETDCDENNKPEKSHGRVDILPDAQWCIAESANGIGFACKGGHNDEPHNHNDIGHFIYEAGGTMFLTDLGAGEYTADYFGAKRYQILCNSSAGHSVPVLNGENQRCGREYRCGELVAYVDESPENTIERKGDSSCRADLLSKGKNEDENSSLHGSSQHGDKTGGEDLNSGRREKGGGQILHAQMDIGSAWPQEKGGPAPPASVQRTFHFNLQTGRLKIEDTFDRTQWGSVTETLITQIPPQVEDNKIYLLGDRGTVVIYVQSVGEEQSKSEHLDHNVISEKEKNLNIEMEGKTPEAEKRGESLKIRVRKHEHRNHVGEAEAVYAICWDVSGSHAYICLQKKVNDAYSRFPVEFSG